jgi:Rod binding domain-containing protein
MDPLAHVSLPALSVPRGLDDGRLAAIERMGAAEGRRAAARELGEVFFMQLVAALRQTLPDGLFPQVPGRDVYEGMFDRQLAQALAAEDPLGLVERLAPRAEKAASVAAPTTAPVGFAAGAAQAGPSQAGSSAIPGGRVGRQTPGLSGNSLTATP